MSQRELDRQVNGKRDTHLDDGLHRKCRLEARLDLRQITETQRPIDHDQKRTPTES